MVAAGHLLLLACGAASANANASGASRLRNLLGAKKADASRAAKKDGRSLWGHGHNPHDHEPHAHNPHSHTYEPADEFDGWNIMRDDYLIEENGSELLDGLSLEWEYFMVHDDSFTGIVGYVLADPRELLGGNDPLIGLKLMPSGMNIAVAGQWEPNDGSSNPRMVSNFVNFTPKQMTAGKDEMTTKAGNCCDFDADPDCDVTFCSNWCKLTPSRADEELRLEGQTDGVSYDVTVTNAWPARKGLGVDATTGHGPFAPARSDPNDIGVAEGEHWTVNMVWPRTNVVGSMTDLSTTTTPYAIDGHGYRENSWGRWTFITDGWDFAIFSGEDTSKPEQAEENGVQWSWQSYHNSDSMDFLDVSFYDEKYGEVKAVQFEGEEGQLGWSHEVWSWNDDATQCAPQDAFVEAANLEYYVWAQLDIKAQVPLLSDATLVTNQYAIMEWIPTITGEIRRNDKSGDLVASFTGQAGGEVSFLRSLDVVGVADMKTDAMCGTLFARYQQTLKTEVCLTDGDCVVREDMSPGVVASVFGFLVSLFSAGFFVHKKRSKSSAALPPSTALTNVVELAPPAAVPSFDIFPVAPEAAMMANPMLKPQSAV